VFACYDCCCFIWLLCLLNAVFNVGEYRRKAAPDSISNSDFFRPDNKHAQEIREYDFTAAAFSLFLKWLWQAVWSRHSGFLVRVDEFF